MRCHIARKNISLAMDNRLEPAARMKLQEHLHVCASCQKWQQEQSWLLELIKTTKTIQPFPGFYDSLQDKINKSPARIRFFTFSPAFFRPILLSAAMFLILIFSAFLGFFLGGRLELPSTNADVEAFNQTMNLNVFADLPADSFGAVYERLLQGELQ